MIEGRNYHELFIHFVWTTKNREPLLVDSIRERLYAVIWKKCEELQCPPVAIGGVEDHVHLLVEMKPTIAPAHLIKMIKGSSSLFISQELLKERPFQWQASYGAFSISKRIIPKTRLYILNQREHHKHGPLFDELERTQ